MTEAAPKCARCGGTQYVEAGYPLYEAPCTDCHPVWNTIEWEMNKDTDTLWSKDERFQIREAGGSGSGPPLMLWDGTYMVGHYMDPKNAKLEAERRKASST